MKKLPRISEAEWEVMRIIWSEGRLTADEVVKRLSPKMLWKRRTIRTLINRLLTKGALACVKEGRAYRYFPKVKEAECIKAENRSFLKRVYGGMPKLLLSHFIEETELSEEDINEIQQLLDKARRNK